jgi:hypothetical protein
MSDEGTDDLHWRIEAERMILNLVVDWDSIGYAVCLLPGLLFQP